MLMNTFMQSRKSVRDYKKKKIKNKDLILVQGAINTINDLSKKYGVLFELYEDGKLIYEPLQGKGGYYGKMIEAPSYISMDLLDENDESYIFGAYYMEELITKLQEIGLGSCWITIKEVEGGLTDSIFFKSEGHVNFILGIGYPKPEINIGIQEFSTRLGLEDFIFIEDFKNKASIEMLESYGLDDLFYYLRYAPSTMNKQPWRFLIKNGKIELFVEDFEGKSNLLDAGIIMYYYVKLAESNGINATWKLEGDIDIENKRFIGVTNF